MNTAMIRYLLAKLLFLEAVFLLVPLFVALIYQEGSVVLMSYLVTVFALFLLSYGLQFNKPKNQRIYAREGMFIVALCWLSWSFFGAIPFVLSQQVPNAIDAFFEMASGFTTTGASSLPSHVRLSASLLFWRSFAHLIGGMGVLVFALAIMTNHQNGHHELMRAEVPGPVFGKVVAKLKNTAQILYLIYLTLFFILVVLLYCCGLPLFDSLILAMSSAGTGGFAVYFDGLSHYNNDFITAILTGASLIFSINFNLYYLILLGKAGAFIQDLEVKSYLALITMSTLMITITITASYPSWFDGLKAAFFQVIMTSTTTGFYLNDISHWPLFSLLILLFLMFIGGCSGSTAGGFKLIRILILAKIIKNEVLMTLYPRRIMALHINQQALDNKTQISILKYLAVYLSVLVLLVLLLSLEQDNFLIATSAAISSLSNIGPLLGTNDNFSLFSSPAKLLLSLAMIAGRLEFYPILLLFMPKNWSN